MTPDSGALPIPSLRRQTRSRTRLERQDGRASRGSYIFENEWQSFPTRKDRTLELVTASHTYAAPGRYTVAVKVVDIFGNDTMTLMPITVG